MKKFTVSLIALVFCSASYAQQYDPGQRDAIEISTGYAPYTTLANVTSVHFEDTTYSEYSFAPSINVGYCHAMSYNWDFLATVNVSGAVSKSYYRDTNRRAGTDFDGSFTISAVFRHIWFRNDNIKLYSSFGIGFSPWLMEDLEGLPLPVPLPSVSLLGITFGKGKVYGVAEATLGTSATAWLVGLGIRL